MVLSRGTGSLQTPHWRKEDSNPRSLSRATRLGHICRGSNVAYERDRTPFLQPNFPMPLERSYSEDTRGSVFLGRGEVGDA
jgi:hypothetical protein